jgi:nucleoside-diphosphate-sugar epimerase
MYNISDCSGFNGSSLIDRLLDSGESVIGIDNRTGQIKF